MRQTWLVVIAMTLLGCRIPNEDHCGRRDGDSTCRDIDPTRPYCSVCEAEHDGCVETMAEIPSECRTQTSDTSTTTATDTDTGPAPACGNGVKEPGEDCDGMDFGESTCADPYQLPEGMLVCVPDECVIDTSQCCLLDGEVCEQGECCNANCNLVTNKCGL